MDDRREGAGKGADLSTVDDVLTWDERRDPAAAPVKLRPRPARWDRLSASERRLLDVLADGLWLSEGMLRRHLGWGRIRFFLVTLRLTVTGWIRAREENSILNSEYRLSSAMWG